MKVWSGSEWKEQNGTDAIKTNVTNLTTKANTLETNLSGLTSEVSSVKTRVTTVENDLGDVEETVETLSSDVSTLQQTSTEIKASVSNKVDQTYGSSSSSFGWSLKSSGFYIYSNASTVAKITSAGLEVSGKITSSSGKIGGFTIDGNSLNVGTWGTDNSVMLCTGSASSKSIGGSLSISGWAITAGARFGVTTSGDLYASNVSVTGAVYATSGSFSNCDIGDTCNIYGYVYMTGTESVKFYGSKCTMNYETWIGGTGTISTITQTNSGTTYTSYAYTRPFGQTIVPQASSVFANDGMIFGIMGSYSFKMDSLLTGVSFFYGLNNGVYTSEFLARCGDSPIIDVYRNGSTWGASWGCHYCTNTLYGAWEIGSSINIYSSSSYIASKYLNSYYYGGFYGTWFFDDKVYFGSTTTGYISTTSQNSQNYPYLAGSWYGSTLFMGTYSNYHTRLDGDQLTFYYGTTQVGEIESYSSYTDIQGTWKTNGNSWISSSDRNLKDDIKDIAEIYDALFDRLVPVTYKWKAGTSGRTHVGFVAQDVKKATEESGLTTKEFAAYVHFDATEKDGEVIKETCGIRYEEITPLNTWEIQRLKKRVSELERLLEEMRNENY